MTRSLAWALVCLLSTAVLLAANPCRAQSYTLTDLGVAQGATVYNANAINNNGQIVGAALPAGASASSSLSAPYIFSNGTVTDIGNFGVAGDNGQAYAVNSLGEVVGLADSPVDNGNGLQAPFLFSTGTLTQLSPDNAIPQGINTAGTIVGYLNILATGENIQDAFVIQKGTLTNLGQGVASGINTSGQIVGTAQNPSTGRLYEALVWQPDLTPTFLGVLGAGVYSFAYAINDSGQVTGISIGPENGGAFLFSNGTMTNIDTLDSGNSTGLAINDNGVVVGVVNIPIGSGNTHAFVFMGGSMMDLNTLIPAGSGLTLMQANGINDAGEIVGDAQSNSDGSVHAFLLTPVAPQITSISPATGTAGAVVTIKGTHFTTKPKDCTVTFNGKVAKATNWTNTEIQVMVPAGATTGELVVTAFFQKSNSKTFTVIK
jgi:probable HAF family extracellular repeat protein